MAELMHVVRRLYRRRAELQDDCYSATCEAWRVETIERWLDATEMFLHNQLRPFVRAGWRH